MYIKRVSTNFCLVLIEPSVREVFLWTFVEREERGASEERSEHEKNTNFLKLNYLSAKLLIYSI